MNLFRLNSFQPFEWKNEWIQFNSVSFIEFNSFQLTQFVHLIKHLVNLIQIDSWSHDSIQWTCSVRIHFGRLNEWIQSNSVELISLAVTDTAPNWYAPVSSEDAGWCCCRRAAWRRKCRCLRSIRMLRSTKYQSATSNTRIRGVQSIRSTPSVYKQHVVGIKYN